MTISILAFDEETGRLGGAAATGSLCVGGWVLRGDALSGLSASQGSLPSTLWGTDVLERMKAGMTAGDAVETVTGADSGRAERQLSAIDTSGRTGHFTGNNAIPAAGARRDRHVVVAGNLLGSDAVLDACLAGFVDTRGPLDLRLLAALTAADAAGGDSRGLLSAALLIVGRDNPPFTLRVDYSDRPLAALDELHRQATSGLYADWVRHVPTLDDPQRAVPFETTVAPVIRP